MTLQDLQIINQAIRVGENLAPSMLRPGELQALDQARKLLERWIERDGALKRSCQPALMSHEEAKAHLRLRIFEASGLLEELETAGRLNGGSLTARENIIALAERELIFRWKGRDGGNSAFFYGLQKRSRAGREDHV